MVKKIILKIFHQIERELNRGRFVFRKTTKKDTVINLINSLHPYQTNYKLIRFGSNLDGGYLIPDDIKGIEACFSPGVSQVSEFEKDCFNAGMKIYLADKSVNRPNLDIPESRYHFIKKFVGCTNDNDFMTMDAWVDTCKIDAKADLLLQMDIEGYEYIAIINMSDSLISRFRIIVIEFHGLQDLWQPRFFEFANLTFNKILKTHTCVHIHPNNVDGMETRLGIEIPRTMEFTFLRNDRILVKKPVNTMPHPLDSDNTSHKTLELPKIWYTPN